MDAVAGGIVKDERYLAILIAPALSIGLLCAFFFHT